MLLDGKVALVIGAGSGIGKAAALLLAQEGAKIGALDLTEDALTNTATAITDAGGEVMTLTADIAQADAIEQAVHALAGRWGNIDIVFANAGINGVWAPIEALTPAEWQRTIDTNLSGTFYTIKYAVPYLKRNGGAVVVTASVNGTRMFTNTGAIAYSTTKAGQVAMVKMLALELARERIRVNVICPGYIESNILDSTEQRNLSGLRPPVEFPQGSIPLTGGKRGKPEQVAQLVLFLSSDLASHITGTEIWIDGGESLLKG